MLRSHMDIYIEAVISLLEALIVVLPPDWTGLGSTKATFCFALTIYILVRHRKRQ